jgi:hypothetical protein
VKSAATGHATFVLTGESASGGPVTIDVKDSKGAGGWTSLTVKPAILTVTIVSKKIHVGDTTTMKVIGGTPPYTVTDSKAILTIQAKGQADFELKGVKAGTAHIEVRDNRNRPKFDYVTVIENVSPLSVSFTTKELKVRDYAFLKISGGSPDYTVTSSSPVVSISWLSPIEYKLVALKAGSATVTVKDSKGLTKTSLITVKETTAPLSISLTSKEIKVGESATLTISGGHPWYGVKVDSTILLLSMESPSSYKLKALKAGISTITVTDARGETKTFSLTVKK